VLRLLYPYGIITLSRNAFTQDTASHPTGHESSTALWHAQLWPYYDGV